jgi:UDP-N-acetylmuramyl pentapeptide phosphotransferase/UDP-N-acetylglucosamine-1-phosphate transferase
MKPAAATTDFFPPLDDLEVVLWPGAALLVFVVSAAIVDLVIVLATRYRLVDLPNQRSAHALPTARGGGIAIVITVTAAAIAVAFRWPNVALGVLLGALLPSLVIGFVGVIDDVQPLRALLRLFLQIAAAVVVTLVLGPLRSITLPGMPPVELGWWAWPLTVLWVVGMINAFNFMDGSDGMAALGSVTVGFAIAVMAAAVWAPAPMVLSAFIAAAAGGFLVFNWHPARVFMGDVGSAFLGTLFAAVPLLFPGTMRGLVFVPVVMALWPYIYDPLVSVIRRAWNGHNPLEPHREFLFHRLIRSGVSHAWSAVLYACLSAAGGLLGIALVTGIMPAAYEWTAPLAILALAGLLTVGIEYRCARCGLASAGGSAHAPR